MKSYFINLPPRFAIALWLLLLVAAHPAFAAVTFTGDTSNDGATVIVGNTGNGSLLIDDGSSLSNTSGFVGNGPGSSGEVNVSGGNWTNSGALIIGMLGNGSLTITDGTVANTTGRIGYYPGSSGEVNVSGGNWTNSAILEIGWGGTGNLTITGGTVSNTSGAVGFIPGSTGIVNVSGGNWTNSGNLTICRFGNGSLTISGGTVTNANSIIGVVAGGNGTVSVSGGTWTNSINLTVGGGGIGSLTINGTGTVIVGDTLSRGSNGTINLENGGTLQIGTGGATGTLATDLTNNGTLIFDRSSDSTCSFEISGTGSLTKNGSGTLTLSGNNTYSGGTTVDSGTLATSGVDVISDSSAVIVESGATFSLGGAETVGSIAGAGDFSLNAYTLTAGGDNSSTSVSGAITGTGSFVKTGAGTLILSGNNSYSGGTTVSSGTLAVSSTGGISHAADFKVGNATGDNGTLTLNGGSVSNAGGFIGYGNGSTGTVNINSGNWTNSASMRVGFWGNGTLNLTGGNISNTNGVIGKYGNSTGVANVSGGTWSTSGYMYVGDEDSSTGTLNLTGGNVVVGGGSGNVTLAGEANATGTLNLGTGASVGSLQAAQVRGGNGTAVVNFNHTGNYSFAPILAGNLTVNKLGSGTTTLTGNNTYTGGTSIQNGTLSVQAPMALGAGNVSLSAGSLLVASGQEMPGSLQIGGNFDWTGGTMAYYDTGSSPGSNDMQIVVGGNFTASAGNKTFDFSQVDALNSGNYTLVLAGNVTVNLADLIATHGPETTLSGTFSTNGTTIVYTVTGATSGGNAIQNVGGPNTPLVADYAITTSTITVGSTNAIRSLSFSNSAALTINATGQLTITSGNLSVQSGGTSVVSGGTLITSGSLAKQGGGELDLQSNTVVNGVATVVEGLLSVNAQLNANSVVVDPTATLGGAGVIVAQNVVVNGNLSPGNSPGTLNVVGNLVLTGANSTIIEIASPTNFDRIVVTGTATLGGTLNAVGYEGYTIAPGSRFDFLQAGSIVGAYDSIIAPEGLRARFLNSGTVGTLLFGPGSYVMMAINQNQRNVAEALDTFILATEGDPLTVSVALDSLTTEQFPAAFDQIMPGFYESLGDILIEQTYNQAQLLTQRLGSVRLGATGFQAIGMNQPIKYDKDGKSAADAKTASPIVESAIDTNWNSWVIANGEFSLSRGLSGVPNYNNNAGGFLVGADYRLSENFAAGLFAGYEYSYAKYDGGSSTRGNSALFGLYGSYTHEDGYYADAIVSGGYTGFQTRRSIEFSTIDRTARANPNSGQFSAALNLGKDFEIGKFTLGPIIGAQYTYAGIGGFTETGADSLDLALGQQNANSLRTNLGARLAYNWEVGSNITLIPEVRGFWMHEFLNNPRNISSALDGGNGASFDYETSAPYRNSVFGGVGISAKFADRWSASVFYNVNFGAEGYTNNIISTSLGFSF